MKATIIAIGDEILIGQITNTNAVYISEELTLLGITVVEHLTVSDTHNEILAAISSAAEKSDLVIMTGGLGPTKDDITKVALAEYLGDELVFFQDMFDKMEERFTIRGRKVSKSHEMQCYLPASVRQLNNSMGTAPGMLFEHNETMLLSMPGVPYEMKAIMKEEFLPYLQSHLDGQVIIHKTILTAGRGESMIADDIEPILEAAPDSISIAYLPSLNTVRLRLTARGVVREDLQKDLDTTVAKISDHLGDIVFGYDKYSLAECVQDMCIKSGSKLGTAESCTGGYVAHQIASVPGASAYYEGSVVTYSYDLKEKLLGVSHETLIEKGAVSEEVVEQMVKGAVKTLGTDYAIAISGIAGPGGGTPEKPVGTVCIAVGAADLVETTTIHSTKDRAKNIQYASNYALNMMRKYLLKHLKN